jgi:hypothetical protein
MERWPPRPDQIRPGFDPWNVTPAYLAGITVELSDATEAAMTPELMEEVLAFVRAFQAERGGVLPAGQHLLDGPEAYDGQVVEFPFTTVGL